ncbi:MAG: hypothetical protein IPG45_38765 [Deltaproteobacteria bacterium]|nr:hypothetical protein [Deltaproteobacteria bacterium]
MVAYAPTDPMLVNIGAGLRASLVVASGARLMPLLEQDREALVPFGLVADDLDLLEEQLRELRVMANDPKLKKADTPLQMAELTELMGRIRGWLLSLRQIGAINLTADGPALARLISPAPEFFEGYPRDLLLDLDRRLQAAHDLRPRLEDGGLSEAFMGRGQKLLAQLKTALGAADLDPNNLPLAVRRFYVRKAQVYLGLKRSTRMAQLAFMLVPDRARRYHLDEAEPILPEPPPKAVKPRP